MQVGQVRERGDLVDRLIFRGCLAGVRGCGGSARRIALLGDDLGGIALHHLGKRLRRHRTNRHGKGQARGDRRVDMPSIHSSSRLAQRTKQHGSGLQVRLSVPLPSVATQYEIGQAA